MAEQIRVPRWPTARLIRAVVAALALAASPGIAQAQSPRSTPPAPGAAALDPGNSESLTVTGHRQKFESAPVPGAPLPPPPDKPPLHLGQYKISGDQEQHDGIDTQTGAQIGAFGTAYTGASPVAGGLSPQHPN